MRSKQAHYRAVPVRVTPLTAAIATAIGSFAGVNLAVAADQPDELVVSATRRDTSLQDVPYSIGALSQSDIESLQIRNLSDLARWSPGLFQIDQGSREANALVIRGLNASSIGAPELLRNTQGDRVSTYFGETPVYINLAPIDLNRVEVLRGPQGTVYGSRSLGGTLRYVPNAPQTDELTIDGHARGFGMSESDDFGYDVDGVINVPVIEDVFALRAVLGYHYTPGFIDQPYVVNQAGVSCPEPFFTDPGCTADDLRYEKDANDLKTTTARVAALWDINNRFSANLSYAFQREESGGRQINSRDSMMVITDPGTGGPLDIGNYASGMRFLEENERDNNIVNLTLTYQMDGAELLSSTSYNSYEQIGNRDQTDLMLYYYYGDFPALSTFTEDTTDDKTFTQEIRLVSDDEEAAVDYILGLYYQDADLQQGSLEFSPNLFADPLSYYVDVKRDTEEVALFGEAGYDLTDKWHIMGGARWFDVDDKIVSCSLFNPACDTGGGDGDDVIYKLGIDYQATDNALLYALFSQGISLGGVNPQNGAIPEELLFVKPEKVDNYEVGMRSTLADGAVTLNGAAYQIDWTDIHVDDFIGGPITRNGGEARTHGLEFDLNAVINDNWRFTAGFTTTTGKITSGPDDGTSLPGFPGETLSVNGIYTRELSSGLGLQMTYGITAQSDMTTGITFSETLPGFSVHSASIGLSGDNWQATLYGNNLFNKYAVTGVRDDKGMIMTDGTVNNFALRRYFQNVLTPRTVGLDLRYRFK